LALTEAQQGLGSPRSLAPQICVAPLLADATAKPTALRQKKRARDYPTIQLSWCIGSQKVRREG